MTGLTNWFSQGVMHSLGWTLLHFLWQGAAVAALVAILMTLCRRASSRYLLAVAGLFVMLAAPVATFFFLPSSIAASVLTVPAATTNSSQVAAVHTAANRILVLSNLSLSKSKFSSLPSSLDALPWLVEAWLFGVALLSLRSAGGFLLLEHERRKQSTTPTMRVLAICRTLQQQLGLDRAIHYCVCEWLQAPAVIGWFRPIVLLPVTALTGLSEEQLRSVVAHELAHILRFDPFVNLFQIVVETLLFYHPAVWWLNKRIRDEREHCCDDVAVALCGNPVEYARALTLMEEWRVAPALAMAANRGPLSERIFRVLGRRPTGATTRGMGLTGSLVCLTAALVAGNALLGIAYPKPVVHANGNSLTLNTYAPLLQLRSSPVPVVVLRPSLAPISTLHTASEARTAPQASPSASTKPAPPASTAQSSVGAADEPSPSTSGSYIDRMKAAGLNNLTVDELIDLKIQGVTPEYVRGIHEQGLQPDANKFVAMRIQGVTPEFVRELRSLGLNPDVDEIVALKIQGVEAGYVRGLKDVGLQLGVDQLIAMKIQGVTPEYVREMREQGVQPGPDTLIGMRIQGVTPEYVRDIRGLGLTPTPDELMAMRVQSVTPDYIKALQAAGFKFDIGEAIGAKIQGITPEFIQKARAHGFQDLTLQKLIQLKHTGVLGSRGEI
jgi:beta-lactamase regulating signal transducer with metallopeptidase domain